MAKKRPNIKLTNAGSSCERVEITSKHTQYNNPIGRVCKTAKGYSYTTWPNHSVGGTKKTKHAAVLAMLRSYRLWVGLRPGRIRID